MPNQHADAASTVRPPAADARPADPATEGGAVLGARRPTELLREILEVSAGFEEHLARQLTVNPTDLHAMEHLIAAGPMGATELARKLGISTAAVTTVIDRLSALGHASRTPHPTDRRAVVVVPSDASVAQALGTLLPMITGIDAVLDEFSAAERLAIGAYLERVVEVYRGHVPGSPPSFAGPRRADELAGSSP